MKRHVKSFIFGGMLAAVLVIIGIAVSVKTSDFTNLATWGGLAVTGFTLLSCLILRNNFIGEMISEIFSWGFVQMPGLIFTLDLDGIIWLLTVKLLFWILGFALAILCGILAISLGLVVSLFVYPFALAKYIRVGDKTTA